MLARLSEHWIHVLVNTGSRFVRAHDHRESISVDQGTELLFVTQNVCAVSANQNMSWVSATSSQHALRAQP